MSFRKEGLHLWPEATCLVSQLAQEVATFGKFSLKNLVIVFPTARLEAYFLSKLAQVYPAFPRPKVYSFENFVTNSLDPEDVAESIVSDLGCELILASLIKEKKFESIRLGDEHEIKQFFGEIIEARLENSCFDDMRKSFEEDIYASIEHLDFMKAKVSELENLYKDFTSLLSEKNLLLKDSYYRKAVSVLKSKWNTKDNCSWEHIYFVGFTTLRKDFLDLVNHLLLLGKTSLWMTEAPNLLGSINPLKILRDAVQVEAQSRIIKTSEFPSTRVIKRASTPMAEVLEAYNAALEYQKKGLAPSQIGIFVSCENTYSALVRAQFEGNFLKSNIAVSLKLSGPLLGSWLSTFIALAKGTEKKQEIIDFLIHPITFLALKSYKKEEELKRELILLSIIDTREERGFERILKKIEEPSISEALKLFYLDIKEFLLAFSKFGNSRSLKNWGNLIDEIFQFFNIYEVSLLEDNGLSNSLKAAAYQFVDSFTEAYECFNPFLSPKEIKDFFQKKLLSEEVRSVGYPLEGVQILRLIESRYIPLEVVIILGCVEGKFPKKLPKDYILDNWIKKKIGLRGWEYVEALEDTTYHLLKKRISRLELFYPASERGRKTIPSRFLEIEKAYDGKVVEDLESSWSCFFSSNKKSLIIEEKRSDFFVDGREFFPDLSAKSLSFLLNCPYKFFLYSLKLEKGHFFESTDYLEEGKILHKILEIFYTGCDEEDLKLPRLAKKILTENIYDVLLKRLKLITTLLFEKKLSRDIVYHLLHYSWPSFVRFLVNFYRPINDKESESFFSEFEKELSFGGSFSKISTPFFQYENSFGDKCQIPLRGSIDSLDKGGDRFLLVDYKRKTVPTLKDQSTYKDTQLLFYLLVYSVIYKKDLESGLFGYWSIMDGNWNPRGVGDFFPEIEGVSDASSLKKKSLTEMTIDFRKKVAEALLCFREENVQFEKNKGKHCESCEYFDFCQPGE